MPSTLTLRRRIKTAQNISKTTRAMQMIAASKLKRAQSSVVASRPYVTKLTSLVQNTTDRVGPEKESIPRLRTSNSTSKILFIIISPDKGLAGGMISNLFREYLKYRKDENNYFVAIGKKFEGFASATTKNLIASFHAGSTIPSFEMVPAITQIVDEEFLSGEVDSVKIITTHFNSVFSQTPQTTTLLPIALPTNVEKTATQLETTIEPSPTELLPALLKRYVDMTIYQSLLESYASYQAAQMIAMQNATNNAKDIVKGLTLLYNKVRQEKITSEILDISGAAAALSQE